MDQVRFEWKGHQWETGHAWGDYHPKQSWMWYDPDAIDVNGDELHITSRRRSKVFRQGDDDWLMIPFAAGVVRLIPDVKYGSFEIDCMLPSGPAQWPGFWIWGINWPREIDIFEGYSMKSGSYLRPTWPRFWSFWHVETNLHRREGDRDEIEVYGRARRHWLGFQDPCKTWNRYGLNWTPDIIEWTFNGRAIRKITDRKILGYFNKPMTLVLSNYMTLEGLSNVGNHVGVFRVRDFRYEPFYPPR